jgi:hypothetical protein
MAHHPHATGDGLTSHTHSHSPMTMCDERHEIAAVVACTPTATRRGEPSMKPSGQTKIATRRPTGPRARLARWPILLSSLTGRPTAADLLTSWRGIHAVRLRVTQFDLCKTLTLGQLHADVRRFSTARSIVYDVACTSPGRRVHTSFLSLRAGGRASGRRAEVRRFFLTFVHCRVLLSADLT